jgi:hypothetical protein
MNFQCFLYVLGSHFKHQNSYSSAIKLKANTQSCPIPSAFELNIDTIIPIHSLGNIPAEPNFRTIIFIKKGFSPWAPIMNTYRESIKLGILMNGLIYIPNSETIMDNG